MSRIYALIALLLLTTWAFGQDLVVKGTVTSSEDRLGIPGASVVVKGTTNGVSTDVDGNYQLKVQKGSILVFSFIGMKPAERVVGDVARIDVVLDPLTTELSEVVVVGYGVQKKSLVTGAISSVGADELERPGLMRADEALQGKAAGVQVMANSGQPGEGLNIRIRGIGTNGTASPLYIVDGQPMDNIAFLNPRDIESMEVLKDAASSAIYGARGANGVVLLTTKKGKFGEKATITYDFYYGFQNLYKKMDLLDARTYAIIQNEAAYNGGQALPFPLDELPKLGKGTDWQEEILYKNAPIMSHQITLSGGAEKSTYNVSASYFTQDGIFAKNKSKYERITIREATDHLYFEDHLKFGQSIIISHEKKQGIDPNNIWGGPILSALNMDPVTPVRNTDGSFAESPYVSQEVVNPVAKMDITHGYDKYSRILASAYGELNFLKDFKLRSSIASEMLFTDKRGYTPVYRLNTAQFNDITGTNKEMSWMNVMTYENVLSYDKEIAGHHITAMVGNTLKQGKGNNVGASKKGLLIDDWDYAYLDLAKNEESAKAWGGAWHDALVSYFGRLNYSYDNRYMLTATFRADGSTRFGKNNRFGYFPSVSVGWNISEEKFMENVQALDYLKLRASWGQNGNEKIGDWQYLATISTGARGYVFGNVMMPGASPDKVANPDLKWETSEQTNIGVDLRFLHKFSASLDYYIKKTKDLLVVSPIPAYVGAPAPYSNAGNVKNSGVEFVFSYNDQAGDFRWNVDFNIAYNKNKVEKVGNQDGWIGGSSVGTAMSNVTRMAEGQPISYFWGFETDGIFQNQSEVEAHVKDGKLIQPDAQPGDFRFKDRNNDGSIDDKDRTNIGKPNPDVTAGLTLGMAWKGFDFSIFFNGMFGNKVFNATRRWDLPMSNYQQDVVGRWHGEGTSNSYPRVTTADANKNYSRPSKFFLEDGSFVRLKNLTLGYSFKNLKKVYIQNLRVYVSGSNLFTCTKYSGLDPEVGTGSVLGTGIDYGMYPQPRTYTLGVNVTF